MFHYLILLINFTIIHAKPSELTFEVPDGQDFCLQDEIPLGNQIKFKFQVLQGGNLDIDFFLQTPKDNGEPIYFKKRTTEHENIITADQTGEYSFCFSNKFSGFTHKIVYAMIDTNALDTPDELSNAMAFFDDLSETEKQRWSDYPLFGDELKEAAFKKTEQTLTEFHKIIEQLEELQTDFKNKHYSSWKFSKTLSEKVNHWGLCQFLVMLAIVILQVLTIRSFFIEKRVNITKINESNSRDQNSRLIARKRAENPQLEGERSMNRGTGNPNTKVFRMGGQRPGLPT